MQYSFNGHTMQYLHMQMLHMQTERELVEEAPAGIVDSYRFRLLLPV